MKQMERTPGPAVEQMLPQNIEAEFGVLGSIIIDPNAILEVVDFLEVEHFYRDANREIYAVILSLYDQQIPSDFITIVDTLERQGKLHNVGGPGYITALINRVPTSSNAAYYGHIVERYATMRRLGKAAGTIAGLAYSDASAQEAIEQAEQAIVDIGMAQKTNNLSTDAVLVNAAVDKLMSMEGKGTGLSGLPTGFIDLDRLLSGLGASDLIVCAARPAMGKSSFAQKIAGHLAIREKKQVLVCTLEMSGEQWIERLLCMESGVPLQRIRTGWIEDDEWGPLIAARDRIATGRILIDETAAITPIAIKTRLRMMLRDVPADILIIDYLQLMKGTGNQENRVQLIDEISGDLKAIAKEFRIPVLVLAQLSREVEKRQSKIPQLSDLRESGAIEQNADVVMFIYRDEVYNPETERKNIADIIVAKHRHGPTGEVCLHWNGSITKFSNLEAYPPQEEVEE